MTYGTKCYDELKPKEGEDPDGGERIREQEGRCKILITTRNQSTLSELQVRREHQHQLQLLKHEEARLLFVENVGGDVKDDNIAAELVKRCDGLPMVFVIVARALKDKSLVEWKNALIKIKRYDTKEIEERVFSALNVSYNFLDDEQKALFLLCAQFRPNSIHVRDLLKHSLGLRLFNGCSTVAESKIRLHAVINYLKGFCLLLEGDSHEYVKMHDVVHGFAVSVACEHVLISSADNELEEWPNQDKLDKLTAISLRNCKSYTLPEVLECPKLESFVLHSGDPPITVPKQFFGEVRELKLLDLSHVHLPPMPQPLPFLVNLQSLCLDSCVLVDIDIFDVGNLKKLRVLSFVGSTMVQLPPEVGQLTCLQLLDLSRSEKLEVIPRNTLSRLTRLEALYIGSNFVQWEAEKHEDSRRSNASLADLKLLPKLATLELCISDASLLPRDLFSKNLESFKVFIGREWDWSTKYDCATMLKLKLDDCNYQLERVKTLLMKAEDLHLDNLQGINNVIPDVDGRGFPLLKHLHIEQSEVSQIIDSVFSTAAFPILESLDLNNLNRLEKICRGPIKAESFGNLKKLNVRNCDKLKSLLSYSMLQVLGHLEEVDMRSCKVMEEIVAKETGVDYGDDAAIKFPKLHTLILAHVPKLISFSSSLEVPHATRTTRSSDAGTSSAAGEIVHEDEPEIPLSLFTRKVSLPDLEELELHSVGVKKIWCSQLEEQSQCIQNLTTLIIHGCGDLKYVFMSSMVKSLFHLKRLEVCECKSLEEIISAETAAGEERTVEIKFPKLAFLKIEHDHKLKTFCTGDLIESIHLKVLEIVECDQLKTFISSFRSTDVSNDGSGQPQFSLFDEKVAFPNLEELHIRCMHKLKTIWHDEIQHSSFNKLKRLTVMHGTELVEVFPSKLIRRFRSLESLVIIDCYVLKEVFDIHELREAENRSEVTAFKLMTVYLDFLPKLVHIWSEDLLEVLSFDSLSSVRVRNCPNVKRIFHASMAKCLPQLEELDICECGVEEIVVNDSIEETPKFLLPQLKQLYLWKLKDLRCFYSGNHTLECPELERLTLYHCGRLQLFGSDPQEMHGTETYQRPLFNFKVAFNLTELSLDIMEAKMLQQQSLPADIFHKVNYLHLLCFSYATVNLPLDLLRKFPSVERLHVGCSKFRELLPDSILEENHLRFFSKIRWLELDLLPNLQHIESSNCSNGNVFQNLEHLTIRECDSLVNLLPFSASFSNITSLDVMECKGLLHIVTLSMARILANLKKMSIRGCNMVTEILVKEEDEADFPGGVIFNKLESLTLHCLGSLTSFCSASCTIEFPSLEELFVTECPRMEVLSRNVIRAPKLQNVYTTEDKSESWAVDDLNTAIEKFHSEMVGFSSLRCLTLSEYPELAEVWYGQSFPVSSFGKLTGLVVDTDRNSFSSTAVPSNLLPRMNYLEELEVRSCDSVEEVFGMELNKYDEQARLLPNLNKLRLIDLPCLRIIRNDVLEGLLEFKSLKLLKISNCNNLRNLFTLSMCSELVQLRELELKGCAMVEEIITGAAMEGGVDQITFPLLESIILESLPSLISFSSASHTTECPSLEKITITECRSAFVSKLLMEPESGVTHGLSAWQIAMPKLGQLLLHSVSLRRIWSNRSCIQNLTSLIVDGCGDLNYAFSSSMLESLVQLRKLEICNCKSLEEILITQRSREGEIMGKVLFPVLESLVLKFLPKLQKFCTASSIECPKLKELQIESCVKLHNFLSDPTNTDEGSSNKSQQANSALFDEKVSFPVLEQMRLSCVTKLKVIWHGEVQNLESLAISDCGALETVFDVDMLRKSIGKLKLRGLKLRILQLERLSNLKHVWNEDPKVVSLFGNLRSIFVHSCPSLRSLFPTSVAMSLSALETLDVCQSGLGEIIVKDSIEAVNKFVFPQLKILRLWNLQNLNRFYAGNYVLECPKLETLAFYLCGRLRLFIPEHQDLQETDTNSNLGIQDQQLFQFKQVVPNLKELSLSSTDVKMIMEQQYPSYYFDKVKQLHLLCFHDTSEAFPVDFLQNFASLEKLHVGCSAFEELLPSNFVDDEGKVSSVLSQIHFLFLDSLHNLRHTWKSSHQPSKVFQYLEHLEVYRCRSLVNLGSWFASFQYLTIISVDDCEALANLMEISIVKSLVNLRSLKVCRCNMATEIVANEENDSQAESKEIIFGKLESLNLRWLNSLTCFCTASCVIKFPSLENVIVQQCPKMKAFSQDAIIAPKLKRVYLSEAMVEWRWAMDLNSTIQQLHSEMAGSSSVQHQTL